MKKYIIPAAALLTLAASVAVSQGVPAQDKTVHHTWNQDIVIRKDGTEELIVYPTVKNVYDGEWKKGEIAIKKSGSTFTVSTPTVKAVLPLRANGAFSFTFDSNFNLETLALEDRPPLSFTRRIPLAISVSGVIDGDSILYKNAFPLFGGDLRVEFTNATFGFYIEMDNYCVGTHSIVMNDDYSKAARTFAKIDGFDAKKLDFGERKLFLEQRNKQPEKNRKASSNDPLTFSMNTRGSGDKFSITKTVNCTDLQNFTLPARFDDTFTVDTPDRGGNVRNFNATWATARAATDGDGVLADWAIQSFAYDAGVNYIIFRSFIPFNVTIPAGKSTSTGAVYVVPSLIQNSNVDASHFSIMYKGNPASTGSVSAADFDQCGHIQGTDPVTSRVANAAQTAETATKFSLTSYGAGWITATGKYTFCLVGPHDWNNVAPPEDGGPDQTNQYYATNDATKYPYLVLTLVGGGASTPPPQPFYFLMRFIPSAFAR